MNHYVSTLILVLVGALVLYAVMDSDALWSIAKQVDQITVKQTTEQRVP